MKGFTRFVGIDVSKDTFCVFHSDTERTYSLKNTPEGYRELIQNLGDKLGQVIALDRQVDVSGPFGKHLSSLVMTFDRYQHHMSVLLHAVWARWRRQIHWMPE